MSLDPLVSLVGYWGLALLFGAAALHKLRNRVRFRAVLAAYDLLPPPLVPCTAAFLCLAEMVLAAGLVIRLPSAALAAAALIGAYAAAMAFNLGRGRRLRDCGCGGRGQSLSWGLVARNVALVAACLVMLIPPGERTLVPLDGFTAVCALAALAAAYGAIDGLTAPSRARAEAG